MNYRGNVYFYIRLVIILIVALDMPLIIKVMIIISILAISLDILRKIPHFVTNDLMNIGMIQNQFLIVFIFIKLVEFSDISNEWKIVMQLVIIALIMFRYFFIIFIFGKVIAFKYINSNNIVMKTLRISIFRKFYNSTYTNIF